MNLLTILRKPVMTEKSLGGKGENGAKRYTFEVDRRATKFQIKESVQHQFGVVVTRVNTSIRKGKSRKQSRSRGRMSVAPVKMAMVTIKSGQKIETLEAKE